MHTALALVLSAAVEAPVAGGLARWRELPAAPAALVACGATLLTHPLAWATYQAGRQHAPAWGVLLAVELAVAAVEAGAYAWALECGWRRGLLLSALANGASCAFGLLLVA
jgi:hypothetical protein